MRNGWVLHLSFHIGANASAKAFVREALVCECAELRKSLIEVSSYVVDRYFGIDYAYFSAGQNVSWATETGWREVAMVVATRSNMFGV
jgi:hypothetical protein